MIEGKLALRCVHSIVMHLTLLVILFLLYFHTEIPLCDDHKNDNSTTYVSTLNRYTTEYK